MRDWGVLIMMSAALITPEAAAGRAARADEGSVQLVPAVAREKAAVPVRELRIGVVCYGGVSLAIYMHGVTKELQSLVWASRWLEAGRSAEELKDLIDSRRVDASTAAYFDALAARRSNEGVVTRVVIDSISGTSAGGINGVFLAKGLSRGVSQSDLRDLWFEKADKWKLLGGRFRGVAKLVGLVLQAPFGQAKPPFRGNAMYDWLLEALDRMDGNPVRDPDGAEPTLVPAGDPLRLFVTTTDYSGYARTLRIGDPAFGAEKDYLKVLRFSRTEQRDQFSREWNPLLAFAARSTSSFPGAFEPVNPEEIIDRLRKRDREGVDEVEARLKSELFAEYLEDGADPMKTSFMDGGVLDNGPFTPVVEDITRRPPKREIGERVLLYLEPDPPPPPGNPTGRGRRAFYGPILKSLSAIPRFQPMAGDLWEVEKHNRRASLLRDLISASREAIARSLPFRKDSFSDAWAGYSSRKLGPGDQAPSAGYLRLRSHSVVEQMAKGLWRLAGLSEDGTYAAAAWAIVQEWASRKGWIGTPEVGANLSSALEDLDVGFQVRRLQFVLDEIQDLYSEDSVGREALDQASRTLAEHIQRLAPLMQVDSLSEELADSASVLFSPITVRREILKAASPEEFAADFVTRHEQELDSLFAGLRASVQGKLEAHKRELREAFSSQTASWPGEAVERIVIAYFGFSRWDELLYPYQRIGDGGELREIRVMRISPTDALALGGGDASSKLGGAKYAHFGAFFSREAREKDYLWGRLDGLERLLKVVGGSQVGLGSLKAGFEAVLREVDEEPEQMRFAAALAREIRVKLRSDPAWTLQGGIGGGSEEAASAGPVVEGPHRE